MPNAAAAAPASRYIVDPIFPVHEIHLWGGSSGVGKSSSLIPTLDAISRGRPVFNYPSHPTPFQYISCDRSYDGVMRMLDRLGYDFDRSCVTTRQALASPSGALPGLVDLIVHANAPLVVIEGLQSLIGKSNDYATTSSMVASAVAACQRHHKTVLGTVHSPKTRDGETYGNPRERVLGSVAWAAWTETLVMVERADPANPTDPRRNMILLPRNAPEQVFEYVLDARGRFVPQLKISEFQQIDAMYKYVLAHPEGFKTSEFLQHSLSLGIPERSAKRWLTEQVNELKLERFKQGYYRLMKVQ